MHNNSVMLIADKQQPALVQDFNAAGFDIISCATVDQFDPDRVANDKPEMLVLFLQQVNSALFSKLRLLRDKFRVTTVIFSDVGDREFIKKATAAGVHGIVIDGYHATRIAPVLWSANARFYVNEKLRHTMSNLKRKLEDVRITNQAKFWLMQKRGISESEAYHALRKMAMSNNKRIGETARDIINLVELME